VPNAHWNINHEVNPMARESTDKLSKATIWTKVLQSGLSDKQEAWEIFEQEWTIVCRHGAILIPLPPRRNAYRRVACALSKTPKNAHAALEKEGSRDAMFSLGRLGQHVNVKNQVELRY